MGINTKNRAKELRRRAIMIGIGDPVKRGVDKRTDPSRTVLPPRRFDSSVVLASSIIPVGLIKKMGREGLA